MSRKSLGVKNGFAKALTAWYQESHRDLPWRNTSDPYAIWLSEIMLQQTQVATVLDYYHRFLAFYPTVQELAAAPIDAVLKVWEGLGYYARCRNLHRAANIIVDEHNGRFPDVLESVEALPGIGRSTAGAILTFAYGQRHPLLDGNVKRVLSRVFDIDQPLDKPPTLEQAWQHSTTLLAEAESPYDYNQAIMELGATVCLPKEARCLVCPVTEYCDAKAQGTQYDRPVKVKKQPTPHYHIGVGVIWHDDKILIQQRPHEGLLGGLWEFPGGKQEPGETLSQTVLREIREELEIDVQVHELILSVKHAYTHFKITLHAYHCTYISGEPNPKAAQRWRWVTLSALDAYAFPKANKTVLERLLLENASACSQQAAKSQEMISV